MSHLYRLDPTRRIALGLFSACALALGVTPDGAMADKEKQMNPTAEKAQQAAVSTGQAVQDAVSGSAEVGKKAPQFVLTDLDGNVHKLADLEGKVVVLEWFNPDCPFVKKHHINHKTMAEAYKSVAGDDVVWFAINSGAEGKQGAGLERNNKAREEFDVPYPILLDMSGIVGKAYGATNTPQMFVIDPTGTLAYDGAIDDNPTPDVLGETNYVLEAVNQVRKGEAVPMSKTKPYGCSVKYPS